MKRKLLLVALIGLFACHRSDKTSSTDYIQAKETNSNSEKNGQYPDGSYCAAVTYHNPNTGTTSTYNLSVEVEHGVLSVIHFPNGGWLDESHFSPEKIDQNGNVNFTTDRGYDYEVQLKVAGTCDANKHRLRVRDDRGKRNNDGKEKEE
jgi:hypothetical protein